MCIVCSLPQLTRTRHCQTTTACLARVVRRHPSAPPSEHRIKLRFGGAHVRRRSGLVLANSVRRLLDACLAARFGESVAEARFREGLAVRVADEMKIASRAD